MQERCGIILDPELKEEAIEVNRVFDRMIWIKLELNGSVENVVCIYIPQTGCDETEKEQFWNKLGKIPEEEAEWIG